jgi:DNA-directed RNA polymerase specialized sigma24 family protein
MSPRTRRRPSSSTERRAEDLLAAHGRAAYVMACVLLRDEPTAARVVALGIADLARSTDEPSAYTRREVARRVYLRSQQPAGPTTSAPRLPPTMVWLSQLAQLQRASLALCVFGGHTHREAARLLGVPSPTVAMSLTSGLKDLGRLAGANRLGTA